ncbi:hypothetical protein GCM10027051_14900 [Niabella terrae]
MKAIWTGAIGFGLVNIPVKMYTATEESSLDLDMLDKKDLSNIKFKRVNEKTGKEVAWANIVKGFNINDKYVVLTDEDFQKAYPEKSKLLNVDSFVGMDQIDSVYFEAPYFLEPQKDGQTAYVLLAEALQKTGMAGLGTFILRNREVLGIIRAYEKNLLIFQRLRFAHEIRSSTDIEVTGKKSKPDALKMAVSLIKQLSGDFDIAAYKDTYTEKLMKIIKSKAKGKKTKAAPLRVAHVKSRDLMAQLKASLGSKKKAS